MDACNLILHRPIPIVYPDWQSVDWKPTPSLTAASVTTAFAARGLSRKVRPCFVTDAAAVLAAAHGRVELDASHELAVTHRRAKLATTDARTHFARGC